MFKVKQRTDFAALQKDVTSTSHKDLVRGTHHYPSFRATVTYNQ